MRFDLRIYWDYFLSRFCDVRNVDETLLHKPINKMSNRKTSSLSVSSSQDERENIIRLASEMNVTISSAVHKAVRQSLRSIGIDPDAPKLAVTRAFDGASNEARKKS